MRIIGKITVRQAFEIMMQIFTSTMGTLTVTAVSEIVLYDSAAAALADMISNWVHRTMKCSLVNIKKN